MKRQYLFLCLAALLAANSFAQGLVQVNNRVIGDVVAPVYMPDGVTGVGSSFTAELLLIGTDGSVTPLTPTAIFRDGAAAGFIDLNTAGSALVPGYYQGDTAQFALRAFQGSSWDTASMRGESAEFESVVGGQSLSGPPMPASTLIGLQSFSVTELPEGMVWTAVRGATYAAVPEPTTWALGFVGAAALLARRARRS